VYNYASFIEEACNSEYGRSRLLACLLAFLLGVIDCSHPCTTQQSILPQYSYCWLVGIPYLFFNNLEEVRETNSNPVEQNIVMG
jgi:hypothetical protein